MCSVPHKSRRFPGEKPGGSMLGNPLGAEKSLQGCLSVGWFFLRRGASNLDIYGALRATPRKLRETRLTRTVGRKKCSNIRIVVSATRARVSLALPRAKQEHRNREISLFLGNCLDRTLMKDALLWEGKLTKLNPRDLLINSYYMQNC